MKINLISFLFLLIGLNTYQNIIAQNTTREPVDSSVFFYQILLKPNDPIPFNKAIKYYQNQYQKHIEADSIVKAANDLEIIATGKYNIGDFNESENLLIKALRLNERSVSILSLKAQKRIYNRLGIIYRNLKSYDKSLSLYYKSFKNARNTRDSIKIIINAANVLREIGYLNQSADTLKYALNRAKDQDATSLRPYILDNLGYTELLSKKDSSLVHISESLSLRKKRNNLTGIFSNYRHLSLYYTQKKNLVKARQYSHKALNISEKIKDPSYELEALGLLISLNNDSSVKRFKFLTDSLETVRQANQNSYAAMKYDVEKEKELTHKAKIQQEQEKRKKNIYFFVSFILILISASIIYGILQKRKQRQLQAIRQTEASISKKIHDGLANDTFQVLSELQSLKETPEHILTKLDKIYLETRDIAKDNSPLLEGTDFEDQLISRLNSYRSDHLNVITRNIEKIEWESFSNIKKDTIYMILGELMTNNKKHSQATLALITFKQTGKKLSITYQDNGLGGPLKKGNGMQNMESRIHAVNGTIIFEPSLSKGLKVQIQV